MTELQKCEYDLLKETLQIINENNLKYFVVCGTALGTVKYGGFIPWDDDVDIALPRRDYEEFIKIMRERSNEKLELQNHRFDAHIPFFYSKIRLNNTTFIEKTVADLDINHGIYIDVFPLDGYPKRTFYALCFEVKKRALWRIISLVYKRDCLWKNFIVFPVKGIVQRNLNKLVRVYENLISKYDISESDLICNFGNSPLKIEYAPKWHYGKGCWATFEDLKVCIPENYDAYLTQKYGNWRADLPKEKQVGHHYYEVCDVNRPYTDYIEKRQKEK